MKKSVRRWGARVDLLRDINITISTGDLVLILGGSGAGKTTLINAIMGYEPAEGQVIFGEKDIIRNYKQMKYQIGYVPQEDLVRPSDIVEDTLMNAAQMRLPKTISPAERAQKVQETLVLFGLERERHHLISKLSGGQRKRLSIAVEYIGDPTLFFLDEPDSGLDGAVALRIMECLRFIAETGKIVMVISHEPDRMINMLDKVIVLAKGEDNCGHLAFYGAPRDALTFFNTSSLEEVVHRINRTDEGGDGQADYYIQKYKSMCGG